MKRLYVALIGVPLLAMIAALAGHIVARGSELGTTSVNDIGQLAMDLLPSLVGVGIFFTVAALAKRQIRQKADKGDVTR